MRRFWLIWPWAPVTLRDVVRVSLLSVLLIVLIAVGLFGRLLLINDNYGFSSKLDCRTVNGDIALLNCIKRAP